MPTCRAFPCQSPATKTTDFCLAHRHFQEDEVESPTLTSKARRLLNHLYRVDPADFYLADRELGRLLAAYQITRSRLEDKRRKEKNMTR